MESEDGSWTVLMTCCFQDSFASVVSPRCFVDRFEVDRGSLLGDSVEVLTTDCFNGALLWMVIPTAESYTYFQCDDVSI